MKELLPGPEFEQAITTIEIISVRTEDRQIHDQREKAIPSLVTVALHPQIIGRKRLQTQLGNAIRVRHCSPPFFRWSSTILGNRPLFTPGRNEIGWLENVAGAGKFNRPGADGKRCLQFERFVW